MNMKKMVYLAMTSVMILLMVSGSMTFLRPTVAAPTGPTSATVNGNLGTDTYTLYPYNQTSLNFGFTEYGETIDPVTDTGLSYNGVDAFANPNVPQDQWNEGWLINITYTYLTVYYNVWAFALYADVISGAVGGSWVWASSSIGTSTPSGRVYGGYTYNTTSGTMAPNGYVTTAPITVLYNGPRSYVALCNTTIYQDPSTPLVSVLLTYIFDKVNKVVIVEKDVKMLNYNKWSGTVLHVEFGDRGEWDLGNVKGPASYADIVTNQYNSYENGYQPFYGDTPAYYDVVQIIPSDTTVTPNVGFEAFWPTPMSMYVQDTSDVGATVQESLSTNTAYFTGDGTTRAFTIPVDATPFPIGNGLWSNAPMVFVNGLEVPSSNYVWNGANTVTFNVGYAPGSGSMIWIIYNYAISHPTMSVEPAFAPYVIGEWVFDLSWTNTTASTNQFEGVTCYGQTDYHNAYPTTSASGLDDEVKYQLAQVFTPFDLPSAIYKQTDRWVEYSANPIGETYFITSPNNLPVLVVSSSEWDQYDQFSERVEDLTNGTVYNRMLGQYGFVALDDGQAEFTGLDPTHAYKFLYSTAPHYESDDYMDFVALFTTEVNDSANGSPTHTFTPYVDSSWTDPTGVSHELVAGWDDESFPFSFTNESTTTFTENYTWTVSTPWQEWNAQPFILFKEDEIDLSTSTSGTFTATVGGDDTGLPLMSFALGQAYIDWYIQHDYTEFQNFYDTYFNTFNPDFQFVITVSYNTVTTEYTVRLNLVLASDGYLDEYFQPIYAYSLPGRYEEGVVGTNAASVDSAGLAMVTAAFKDKFVEYGLSAGDTFAGTSTSQIPNQMPYVMSPTGTGTTWASYYYTDGSFRTGLMDDWGTSSLDNWGYSWPVSSANMIVVGGPLANLAAYYANDFETAFYGLSQFTTYATWQNAIVPLTCYSAPEKGYTDTNTVGYGVVSATMDLNGTVQFLIWGNWGRDTFYLSQWFQQEGIFELQEAPNGLTSIVVQITYQSTTHGYQPTGYNVVECLGTISETQWIGSNVYGSGLFTKGGWHPDP